MASLKWSSDIRDIGQQMIRSIPSTIPATPPSGVGVDAYWVPIERGNVAEQARAELYARLVREFEACSIAVARRDPGITPLRKD